MFMISFASIGELKSVLGFFGFADLNYVRRIDAGPDEELYLFADSECNEYGLWERDYMSKLKYEADFINDNFNIKIKEWLPTLDGEDAVEFRGDWFVFFRF